MTTSAATRDPTQDKDMVKLNFWFQWYKRKPGPQFNIKITSIGNPIVEIRRSYDRLISTMGFPILVRQHLYIESLPWGVYLHLIMNIIAFQLCTLISVIVILSLWFLSYGKSHTSMARALLWKHAAYCCLQFGLCTPHLMMKLLADSPHKGPVMQICGVSSL